MNEKNFKSLILRNVTFPGEHIQDLAQYLKVNALEVRIQTLILDNCDIGDGSITALIDDVKRIKTLKELRLTRKNLNHGQHTKEILKSLVDHKSLKILDLSFNKISGLKEIATLLVKNHVIS